MNDRIYYNFVVNNETDNHLILDKTDNRTQDLITNPEEWSLQILKFSLPTEAIQSFNIQDKTKYQITLASLATEKQIAGTVQEFYDLRASNPLPNSSEYEYNTYEDLVEAINRVFLKTHRDLLEKASYNPVLYQNVVQRSFTYDINVNGAPFVNNHTINISGNIFGTGLGNGGAEPYVAYIKLGLRIGNILSYTSKRYPIRVSLIDPSGESCLVFAGLEGNYNNQLWFEDCSFNSLNDKIINNNEPIPAGDYQPVESFIKLNNRTNQTGNWTLRVESQNWLDASGGTLFDQRVSYDLFVYYLPKGRVNSIGWNQFAPALRINDTNNKLELLLHETYFQGYNAVYFTPKLNDILGFKSVLQQYNGQTVYKLTDPQVILSSVITNSSFITYSQPVSTLYKLTNIRAIQIRSNNLQVLGEYDSVSGSNIIMSIDINTDTTKDRYEFQTALPRFYDLVGNIPISSLNFSVWIEYNNRQISQAYLPPNSTFTMLVQFIKKRFSRL